MRWLVVHYCIFFVYTLSFASTFKQNYDANGKNIIILGDSFFTSEKNISTNQDLKQVLAEHFNSQNIFNFAIDGGRYLINNSEFNEYDILSKYFRYNWDLIILGGGANDFELCNLNQTCLSSTKVSIQNKIRDFLSAIGDQNVYFVYSSVVSNQAPAEWKQMINAGGGKLIKGMYLKLASENVKYHYIDLGEEMQSDKKFWLEDGYHPSIEAYKLIPKYLN